MPQLTYLIYLACLTCLTYLTYLTCLLSFLANVMSSAMSNRSYGLLALPLDLLHYASADACGPSAQSGCFAAVLRCFAPFFRCFAPFLRCFAPDTEIVPSWDLIKSALCCARRFAPRAWLNSASHCPEFENLLCFSLTFMLSTGFAPDTEIVPSWDLIKSALCRAVLSLRICYASA